MVNKKPETTATESEENTEQLAREECVRLTRQLRLMENDKKAYLEESNAVINQQRKTIRSLEEENCKIEAELEANMTRKTEPIDGEKLTIIMSLVDQYLALETEVKNETKVVNEVGKQLSFASARLAKLKARVESKNFQAGKYIDVSNKELDSKEFTANRKLQTVTSQFDAIVAENCSLRKRIDAMLKENVRIMKKVKELEENSAKNKGDIDDLVDLATSAYDQREEAVAKANALAERNEKEKKQYILEISELKRLIRHEEKLLDFMSKKNQDRVFLETENERLSRLESAKERTMDAALESYQENLSFLLTNESPTLPSLVEEYVTLWNNNIDRFNYINDMNHELEILHANAENLREEIKQCANETVEKNQKRTAEITKKQEELEVLQEEHSSIKTVVSTYNELMTEIIHLIKRMFYITDFEEAKPVLELIGGNQQEIRAENSILYLNILESRIVEIFSSSKLGISGRATPKSPRHLLKPASDITSRPRIIISGQTISINEDGSGDEAINSIVEEEPTPLEYFAMRKKLLSSNSSKNPSDTESNFNED